MVSAKATADDKRRGCEVSISMEGNGHKLVEEILALIQGVMGSLKEQDLILHLLVLQTIADHSEILLGEEMSDERLKVELAKAMSGSILEKGVN